MKRMNPKTGKPFKRGDVREDGLIFLCYGSVAKKTGMRHERWLTKDKMDLANEYARSYSKANWRDWKWGQTQLGRLSTLASGCKQSAKQRNQSCNIDKQTVFALWDKQNGCCAYTGWPMDFTTKSPRLVSIERINNSIGYEPDNVLLVCWCVNRARGGMTQDEFFAMCKAIVMGRTDS